MATIWPWIVISCGIVVLFGYRFFDDQRQFQYKIKQFFQLPVIGDTEHRSNNQVATKDGVNLLPHRSQARKAKLDHDWMRALISLLVLLSALYIILSALLKNEWIKRHVG
jgi:hypothetical protein